MGNIVTDFKALTLTQQHEAYAAITTAYNASKESRRLELESEIRFLGFTPGEGKRKPTRTAKYVGPNGEVWTGVGAMASWLRKLKEAGEDIERYRASS